eukprot:TRINITY_DN2582_c0_g1_i12.p1 TRINITY_DN2582_c0_g1~~TRINITY_DN2582_c0_g1_i12.p1  ORF type:complete len:154 (+),score=26.75 TRINITY_DN2582_c0_g1_i12:42-503(+)
MVPFVFVLSNDPYIFFNSEKKKGITELEADPFLHGAGLHCHPPHGKLDIHLDYTLHPLLNNKERRLNLILFLCKDWKPEFGGELQLWDSNLKSCIQRCAVHHNYRGFSEFHLFFHLSKCKGFHRYQITWSCFKQVIIHITGYRIPLETLQGAL